MPAIHLPQRPRRQMPTLWMLASYWVERGTFDVDLECPHCFACLRDFRHEEQPRYSSHNHPVIVLTSSPP